MGHSKDILWKLIVEEVFDDLLRFVYPQADEFFDLQGKRERDFPERMFRYFYRIFDRWHQPVAAIAILTGPDGIQK